MKGIIFIPEFAHLCDKKLTSQVVFAIFFKAKDHLNEICTDIPRCLAKFKPAKYTPQKSVFLFFNNLFYRSNANKCISYSGKITNATI